MKYEDLKPGVLFTIKWSYKPVELFKVVEIIDNKIKGICFYPFKDFTITEKDFNFMVSTNLISLVTANEVRKRLSIIKDTLMGDIEVIELDVKKIDDTLKELL